MPKMIVSIDGVVIKEVELTKDRTSLGRRPYNDIVIDNLAVSGEHAVLQMSGTEVHLEDLNSTNGTYVNGKAIKKLLLQPGDTVEIGKYKVRYVNEAAPGGFDNFASGGVSFAAPASWGGDATALTGPAPLDQSFGHHAAVKVLSGAGAGREISLVKVVTTIGKPGVAVAAITKKSQGYVVSHVEGAAQPMLNGVSVGAEPAGLKNGDLLELAGTQMQFLQH